MWHHTGRTATLGLCLLLMAAGCAAKPKTHEGTGPSIVPPFTTADNWQLQYEFTGQVLRITVLDEFGDRVGTVSQQGSGRGVSRYPNGGLHSLEIQTEDSGMWKITLPPRP